MNYETNDIEVMIAKLQHQTKSYLEEIKKLVAELNKSDKLNIISYFTYSLDISHDPTQESLCLGSYHIMNIGNKSITNPYLCIKISKESPFSLSGKYVYEDFKQSLKGPGGWQRINEKTNKEEFWLKPLGKSSIEPNETMSFSNFQITWSSEKSYAGSITGFTYSDQIEEGIAVVNPISLNGTILKQGDENE
ncbi:hypothetical protein [Psychrobacillus sp. OK032]|uniref:hypothetical protein n=1 Tax=Psychrobacillus sp. OK032 TaxID=1884358 RepID=UPI0008BD5D9C|nr:hypothetical protein [Psychrobacillus sp. OK032]SES30804.1 hypothetical protein SAMN05518872_107225 [Psychrobacillus sp. OK032]